MGKITQKMQKNKKNGDFPKIDDFSKLINDQFKRLPLDADSWASHSSEHELVNLNI